MKLKEYELLINNLKNSLELVGNSTDPDEFKIDGKKPFYIRSWKRFRSLFRYS